MRGAAAIAAAVVVFVPRALVRRLASRRPLRSPPRKTGDEDRDNAQIQRKAGRAAQPGAAACAALVASPSTRLSRLRLVPRACISSLKYRIP